MFKMFLHSCSFPWIGLHTSCFGKGKLKAMPIVMKNEKFTNVFSKLSEGEIPYRIVSTTVEYVYVTYGFKFNRLK